MLKKASNGVIPVNTEYSSYWAEKNFLPWAENCNKKIPDDSVPMDLLHSHDPELVCKHLCCFAMETRKENGELYPPATIRSLLCGLNRILKANKVPFSIFDKEDSRFLNTIDSVSSELHKKGVGSQQKQGEVITREDEDTLWNKGILGQSTPQMLQHTIFVYVGLQFCLRGVQEQYDLTITQFVRSQPDTSIYNSDIFYSYTELVSKNNQHRFKDIDLHNKQVRAYAVPGDPRCLVKLLDLYVSRLPPDAKFLYMHPLMSVPCDPSKPWYTKQRVGINTIKGMIPKIFEKAELQNKYSNHSLRATSITRMFNAGITEKVIAERSGHRSLKALRTYEKTSVEQEQLAGQSIAKDISETDKKPPKASELQKDPESLSHTFSGTLNNCTININYK